MKPRTAQFALAITVTLALVTGSGQSVRAEHPVTFTVAAANSLRDALKEILPLFETQYKDVNVRVVYGPSQTLREQIEQGAPVDVFLPSSIEEITRLEQKGLVVGTPTVYGATALVLITGTVAPAPVSSIQDLRKKEIRRIAIGNPKTSSVGQFAAELLINTKLDQELKSRYVYGEHSGAVLDLVAKGEADVGLVYRTDAARRRQVRIVAETPADFHQPVIYGLAAVWTVGDLSVAREFANFMRSPEVQVRLQQHGFGDVKSNTRMAQQQR